MKKEKAEPFVSILDNFMVNAIQVLLGLGILILLVAGGVASLLMLRFYMPEVGVEFTSLIVVVLRLFLRIIMGLIVAYLICLTGDGIYKILKLRKEEEEQKKKEERKRLIKDLVRGMKKK